MDGSGVWCFFFFFLSSLLTYAAGQGESPWVGYGCIHNYWTDKRWRGYMEAGYLAKGDVGLQEFLFIWYCSVFFILSIPPTTRGHLPGYLTVRQCRSMRRTGRVIGSLCNPLPCPYKYSGVYIAPRMDSDLTTCNSPTS